MADAPQEDYKYQKFMKFFNPEGTLIKVRIALFGLGRAGTIHLRNLIQNPRVEISYIVEERSSRSQQIQQSLGLSHIPFIEPSQRAKVFTDPRIDAVLIATPTQSHQALVVEALQSGKAVFCEKPIANDIREVEKCYETASHLGLPLFCAFNRRFDPSFLNVKTRVQNGEIGSVHMIKTCSRDSPLPSIDYLKISNGIFHDCAVHDIDLVCWVLGEFPCKVFASATAHREAIRAISDFDTVAIHLTFPSGAMALIDLSRHAVYGYDQRLEVFGPGGMLSCGNQSSLGVITSGAGPVQEAPMWFSFASRYEDAYKRELDHFIDVIQGKESIEVEAKQTLAVCRTALACEEAVRTGNVVLINHD